MLLASSDRRGAALLVSLVVFVASRGVQAQGAGGFRVQAPLRIPAPNPVSVTAADFNRDGKLDLASVNGGGSLVVLLQNPQDRLEWKQLKVAGPPGGYLIRSADLDSGGNPDLVIADPGSTAYFLLGRGDGTFGAPIALAQSRGSREIAIGDWNGDRFLDLASADHDALRVSVFLGNGDGTFQHSADYRSSGEPHSVKTLDYDGDAKPDLLVGIPEGFQLFQGKGDGSFLHRTLITNLGCYGRYPDTGDFNRDGKGDLVAFCDSVLVVGISQGDGTYRKTFEVNAPGLSFLSSAIEDLNGDGFTDLVFTGNRLNVESRDLVVFPGRGDGLFGAEVVFDGAGFGNSYLIASDLDVDGHPDLVSADSSSSSLTVIWGRAGERFLEMGSTLTGFTSVTALEVADLDRDGGPDLFLSSSAKPEVKVYLDPGLEGAAMPDLTIAVSRSYSSLQVSDLDGDGGPDLAGVNRAGGTVLAAILDSTGRARVQVEKPSGLFPWSILVDRLDDGGTPDLAAPSNGSGSVAICSGLDGGAFADALTLSTIEKPKRLASADLDGDARRDLAVMSGVAVAVHYRGDGAGPFAPAATVHQGDHAFSDLAAGDLDGDGRPDLLASDLKSSSILVFGARADRTFEKRDPLPMGSLPIGLGVADLDGDALLDISAASSIGRSVTVFLNRGDRSFAEPVEYLFGFSLLGHRLSDLDLDGALDLLAFKGNIAVVLAGVAPGQPDRRFVRGDADGDGRVEINDPIVILGRLFLGGAAIACEDAADADDNGEFNLTDSIAILIRLFLGGAPLPPPAACGEDPSADLLASCRGNC